MGPVLCGLVLSSPLKGDLLLLETALPRHPITLQLTTVPLTSRPLNRQLVQQ